MTASAERPDPAAISRYGNLLLQVWAPPAASDLATDTFRKILLELDAAASQRLLIGYRPNRVRPVLASQPDPALDALLQMAKPSTQTPGFHELPPQVLRQNLDQLAAGTLAILCRQTRNGREEIRATHVGRPGLLVSPDSIRAAFCRPPASPDVLRFVAITRNPLAGYHQNVARQIKTLAASLDRECLLTWRGQHLELMGTPPVLSALAGRLYDSLGA